MEVAILPLPKPTLTQSSTFLRLPLSQLPSLPGWRVILSDSGRRCQLRWVLQDMLRRLAHDVLLSNAGPGDKTTAAADL